MSAEVWEWDGSVEDKGSEIDDGRNKEQPINSQEKTLRHLVGVAFN